MVYRASLRPLDAEQLRPPFSPVVALARLFALLAEQYQVRQSFDAIERKS